MEAVILAGGLGTRLRNVVRDVPKPMAPVAGKPFLTYLLDYLSEQTVNKVILAVGYKREVIQSYFGNKYNGITIAYSVENTPLKTGGALKKALNDCEEDQVVVLNGDTFYHVDLREMMRFHMFHHADITMAVKKMTNFDRYGTVDFDDDYRIVRFNEKQPCKSGFINGGVYIFRRKIFSHFDDDCFMLEKDFMEKSVQSNVFSAFVCNDYFIDIGIPEDFQKAGIDFQKFQGK